MFVPIDETIRGFNMIMDGEVDEYPEAAFNLVGTIDDAIAKGKEIISWSFQLIEWKFIYTYTEKHCTKEKQKQSS